MVKVEMRGGRPAVVIDGKVYPPAFATVRTRDNGGKDIHFDGSYFESLGKAGIKVFFLHCNTIWLQPDAIELFDKEARALFAAFDREKADKLLLLGDLLYHGPRNDLPAHYAPKEVISMLNARASKLLCVRGNCDTEVDQMVLNFPILADYAILSLG